METNSKIIPTAEEILDNQRLAVLVLNTDYQIQYSNKSAAKLLTTSLINLQGLVNNQNLVEINNRFYQPIVHDLPGHPDSRTVELSDVTDTKIDPLTGLHNLSYLLDTINALSNGHTSFAAINFDADNLKKVNDEFGHDTGNLLLREIANLLSNSFRDTDCLARVGGDEFETLMFGENLALETVIDRITQFRQHITEYNRNHLDLPINMSIGYDFIDQNEFSPHDNENNLAKINQTRKNADQHMYDEKNEKKGYGPTYMQAVNDRLDKIAKDEL